MLLPVLIFFLLLLIWIKSIFWHKMSCFHKPIGILLWASEMEWMILKQMNLPQNEFNNKDTGYLYFWQFFFILETSFHNSNQTVANTVFKICRCRKNAYYDLEFLIRTISFKNDWWSHLHKAICNYDWINQ